jgi:hypothetical protein
MATPRLQNAFDPKTYTRLVEKAVLDKSVLFNSTAISRNAEFDRLAGEAGLSVIMPYFDELDGDAEVGSRDASVAGAVGALNMGDMIAQKDFLSKAWGVSKLDAQLSGVEDVLSASAEKTARYWLRQYEALLVRKLKGIIADSEANHEGDMVKNIYNDVAVGSLNEANFINPGAVIDTMLTLGDNFDDIGLIVMPTVVYGNGLKNEADQFAAPSSVSPFTTYRNKPVLVTDGLTSRAGSNAPEYTTYFLGTGAFGFGAKAGLGGENVIVTDERAGRNMGATDLITRQPGFIMHPTGYTSKAPITDANAGPLPASYEAEESWTRVADRKAVKVAALKSNG